MNMKIIMTTLQYHKGKNQCSGLIKRAYLLDILKDQIQLPPPAEGLFQLNNVLLLEGAEHLKLP